MLVENDSHITQLNQNKEKLSPCSKFVIVLFVRMIDDLHNSVGRRCRPSCLPPHLPHRRINGNCQMLGQITLKLCMCFLFSHVHCPGAGIGLKQLDFFFYG